mgnify:CR=1 FL=1
MKIGNYGEWISAGFWLLLILNENIDSIPCTKAADLDQTNNLKTEITHFNLLALFLRISIKLERKILKKEYRFLGDVRVHV